MSFSFDRLAQNFSARVEAPVRQHLGKVYSCLTGTTLVATVGAYAYHAGYFDGHLLSALASIGLLLALYFTKDNGKNFNIRLGMLLGFGFCTGNSMGPFLEMAIHVNPQIIMTALIGTTVVFLSFTAAALLARRGQYLFLGGILMSILGYMSLFSLANLFLRTRIIYESQLYIGLGVMSVFILYDTQAIMEKYRMGHRDAIAHSLDLFIDLVSVFRRLLIILTQKEQREQQNRKKRNN